ncbi:MAG: hypothetical protein LC772_12245, partial [Chloroflexi bacterium]|nr:hypothetical protein [Chloroflexota bacterium]
LYISLYTLVSAYDLNDRFVGLLVAFVLLHFGSVFLFSSVLPGYLNLYPGYGQTNSAAEMILYFLERSGDACLVVAGFRLVAAMISLMRHGHKKLKVVTEQKIKEGPATGAAARIKPVYRAFKRCWETSYCQEYLLQVCPAWLSKKTCWKYGTGCMCDTTMLDRLIRIEMGDTSEITPTAVRSPRSKYYGGPNKCHNCPIYLNHEEEKYRLLNPLVLVTVLALLVVYWDTLGLAYQMFAGWIGHVIAAIAFGPTAFLAREWTQNFLDPFVQTSLVICGAIVLVSQILKVVEWAILEKKL